MTAPFRLSVGTCATLASTWEATAAKPGNVYRGADFEDVTYADFVTSAAVIGPIVERASTRGLGRTVLAAVEATRQAVATNTNLGMLLLISPLACVPQEQSLEEGVPLVLSRLTLDDTRLVYQAIRQAAAGGLGRVPHADVTSSDEPLIPLVDAMRLAADRDLVARQYVNGFAQVFQAAASIGNEYRAGRPLGQAIVDVHVRLLAAHSDSLVARKCGPAVAEEVLLRAKQVLEAREISGDAYRAALAELDFWLRADGHRRNPGTTADLIAAGLFVLLRERRLEWPVRFY
jgi:triphosphoribosyl-dephospho-CoA synthase